jgi:hypothetical protein
MNLNARTRKVWQAYSFEDLDSMVEVTLAADSMAAQASAAVVDSTAVVVAVASMVAVADTGKYLN